MLHCPDICSQQKALHTYLVYKDNKIIFLSKFKDVLNSAFSSWSLYRKKSNNNQVNTKTDIFTFLKILHLLNVSYDFIAH